MSPVALACWLVVQLADTAMSVVEAIRHVDEDDAVDRVRLDVAVSPRLASSASSPRLVTQPGSLELKGRATVTWSHELPLQHNVEIYGDRLPPGSACLNRFPIINLEKPSTDSWDAPEGAHELDLQEETPEMNAVCALLLATIEAVGGDAAEGAGDRERRPMPA